MKTIVMKFFACIGVFMLVIFNCQVMQAAVIDITGTQTEPGVYQYDVSFYSALGGTPISMSGTAGDKIVITYPGGIAPILNPSSDWIVTKGSGNDWNLTLKPGVVITQDPTNPKTFLGITLVNSSITWTANLLANPTPITGTSSVPEPSTCLLMGAGFMLMTFRHRKSRLVLSCGE
jgi:hypothetical protein